MRDSVKDDWGIKELQNCILNICQYIHEFCEENNIRYCIMGGTALGALRHGGFIPWDDDMDLFMTPNEYLKFRKVFKKKGNQQRFYLQELGESNGKVVYAKLRLNDSTFIENEVAEYDIHHGVFVDIMILHHYPDKWIKRCGVVLWQTYLEIKSFANKTYKKRGFFMFYALKPLSWLPKRLLLNYALTQVWKYKDIECSNYFHYYIGHPLRVSVYPKEIFSRYELVDFEMIKLYAPKGLKKYLTIMFGDYMQIPNIKDIKWKQHAHNWSPNTSFEKKGRGTFEAEKYLW